VKINVVFNITGTDELQKLCTALNQVASVNEIVDLEKSIENLKNEEKTWKEKVQVLTKEFKELNDKLGKQDKRSSAEDECKKQATPSINRDIGETSIRR